MSDPAPVRILGVHERPEGNDFEEMTPGERVGMMWQLALDAWGFQGSGDAESRLPRHTVRTSLEPRKVYEVLRDPDAAKHGQLRVVDESGEDYLYPQSHFAEIDLPPSVRKAVLAAG